MSDQSLQQLLTTNFGLQPSGYTGSQGATGYTGSASTSGFVDTNSLGMRNRLINGTIMLDQRNNGASQTITAGAALAYTVDRWYAYCTGANVAGQRVAGANANLYRYQFTGAAGVTAIGFGQRIEAMHSADLAGTTATLSVNLSNSVLTTVTWTAYYANTTDTFGTLASPTRTLIASGTFTVTSTVANYTTQISIPSAASTGIEIVFSVGAQTSGTWTIGNVQFESGTVATPFERRFYQQEYLLCCRYYQTFGSAFSYGTGSAYVRFAGWWIVPFRATPTLVTSGGSWGHDRFGYTTVLATNAGAQISYVVSEL